MGRTLSGRISIETADPRFGLADQVVLSLDDTEAVELAEDADAAQPCRVAALGRSRRSRSSTACAAASAWLYLEQPAGAATARGLAGAFGVGCVRVEPGQTARVRRAPHRAAPDLGQRRDRWTTLCRRSPAVGAGSRSSIPDVEPEAPLQELQRRMRLAEAELAEELGSRQVLTVLDGTLALVRAPDAPDRRLRQDAPPRAARTRRPRASAQLARRGAHDAVPAPPPGSARSTLLLLLPPRRSGTAGEPVVRRRAARGARVGRTRAGAAPGRRAWRRRSFPSRACRIATRGRRRTCNRSARSRPACATCSAPRRSPRARCAMRWRGSAPIRCPPAVAASTAVTS